MFKLKIITISIAILIIILNLNQTNAITCCNEKIKVLYACPDGVKFPGKSWRYHCWDVINEIPGCIVFICKDGEPTGKGFFDHCGNDCRLTGCFCDSCKTNPENSSDLGFQMFQEKYNLRGTSRVISIGNVVSHHKTYSKHSKCDEVPKETQIN